MPRGKGLLTLLTILALMLLVLSPSLAYHLTTSPKVKHLRTPDLESASRTLIILHTNDFHGHLKPIMKVNFLKLGNLMVSGYPNIATIVRNYRENYPNVLYLDAGDWITGSLLCDYYHGESVIKVMNILKPDAATIGNHEFDWGVKGLNKLLRMAKFDVVVANVFPEAGSNVKLVNVKPFVIKNVGSLKVGIIGVVTPETPLITMEDNVKGLRFVDPLKVIREYEKYLGPKVDLLVVLSHNGKREDVEMAKHLEDVDIIVGGHSHTKLLKPIVVENGDHKVYVVQAYKYGIFVGRMVVKVKGRDAQISQYNLLPVIDDIIPDDPATKSVVDKLSEELSEVANQKVAELSRRYTRDEITKFSAEIAKEVTGADVGVMNTGGIRSPLGPGVVTYEDLYACFPFHNYLVVVQLKGKDLRDLIKHGIRRGNVRFAGVDLRKTEGGLEIYIGEERLNPEKVYKVATVDFLARGGDGYFELKRGKIIYRGKLFREVMRDYLKKLER